MAAFKTHVVGGGIVGCGCALMAVTSFHLTFIQAFSVFIMGVIGGVLPDIDSDSGKPLALIFGVVSVLLPVLLLDKIAAGGNLAPESLVSYFVISYLVINYLICGILKAITAHRGIIHSLPFAVLAGEVGYLLFLPSGDRVATMVAVSVFSGCLSHLILDELHSLSFKYVIIPSVKNSFGTAIKLKSNHFPATVTIYALVLMAAFRIAGH